MSFHLHLGWCCKPSSLCHRAAYKTLDHSVYNAVFINYALLSNQPLLHAQLNSLNPSHSIWVYIRRQALVPDLETCVLLFKWLKDKTAGCSLWGKINVLQICTAKRRWDELGYFCSYSIQRFLLTKHYTCSKVWVRLFFALTWHCDRRMIPPSILLGNETNLALFHLSFDLLGTESGGHFIFLSSLLRGGKEGREKMRRERASYSYRVKSTDKQETDDSITKSDLQDEKRHKGLHGLTFGVPFITTSISFLPLRGDVTKQPRLLNVPMQPNCKRAVK